MKVELITFKNNLRADYVRRIAELLTVRQRIAETPITAEGFEVCFANGQEKVKEGTYASIAQQLAEIDARIDELDSLFSALGRINYQASSTGDE